MVTSCGDSTVADPSYRYHGLERGDREFAVLQYTLSGEGRLRCAGRTHHLLPGNLMVVPIPHDHEYFYPVASDDSLAVPWRFIFVCLTGAEVMRAIRAVGHDSPVLPFSDDHPLVSAMWDVVDAMATSDARPSPFVASALAYRVVMELLAAGDPQRPETRYHRLLAAAALRYIGDHLAEPLTVGMIAGELGATRSHFSRIFTRVVGLPPGAYIEEERVRLAVDLLFGTPSSIKEIGHVCGFTDTGHFSRVFRKKTGLTPTEYRRRGL